MDERTGVFARESTALDRALEIGLADGRLLSVGFPEQVGERDGDEHPLLDRIEAAFGGEPDDFADIDPVLTLPTDRRRVLEAVRAIPHGEQQTVAAVARATTGLDPQADDAAHTVRAALQANPVPVVVPDHRVSDGPSAAPDRVAAALRRAEGI